MRDKKDQKNSEPESEQDVIVETRSILRWVKKALKVMLGLAIVLIVVVVALQLQVSSRNDDIRDTKVSTAEAKEAARDAKKAVEDAIAQSQGANGGFDVQKLVDGLNAMARVEQYVCGGPCPDEPPTTTTGGN